MNNSGLSLPYHKTSCGFLVTQPHLHLLCDCRIVRPTFWKPVPPGFATLPGATSACQGSGLLSSATSVFRFCAWHLSDLIAQGCDLPETNDLPIWLRQYGESNCLFSFYWCFCYGVQKADRFSCCLLSALWRHFPQTWAAPTVPCSWRGNTLWATLDKQSRPAEEAWLWGHRSSRTSFRSSLDLNCLGSDGKKMIRPQEDWN